MKRIVTLAMTFAISLMVCVDGMADSRNNRRDNGGKGNRREQVTNTGRGSGYSRPGYSNNGGTNKPGNGVRPGVGGNHNGGSNKPGNGVRPGLGGNHNGGSNKPGNGVRPGVGGNHNGGPNKPGNGVRPGVGGNHNGGWQKPGHGPSHRPTYGPTHGVRPGNVTRPGGMRPPVHAGYRPGGKWHRPEPPRGWRPGGRRVPAFRSVLGINFGLSLTLSLQALRASNYVVSGYGGNEVYLSNVPMQGYYWPEATLYYDNGGLAGSQFVYATTGYDMARYNGVYNSLYNAYGAPVSVSGAQVTWFGGNNEFITLNFSPVYSGGTSRFYTTLSFGI